MKKRKKDPLSISALLPRVLKPITKKISSNILEIKSNWEEILGSELSKNTHPSKIYQMNNKNVLEIIVNSNNALEISHNSYRIQKKINNFFQFDSINLVKFKKEMK